MTATVTTNAAEHTMFERRVHALVAGVALLAIALAMTVAVAIDRTGSVLQSTDDRWLRWMVDIRTPWMTRVARVMAVIGGPWVMVPLRLGVLAALLRARRWLQFGAFLGAVVTSELCIGPLKALIDRPRPPDGLTVSDSAAFPSGHAIAAAVTAIGLVVVLVPARSRRLPWTVVAVAFATLMAMSRTYLGVHWLSDVIAGACIGTGLATVWPAALELERARRRASRPASGRDSSQTGIWAGGVPAPGSGTPAAQFRLATARMTSMDDDVRALNLSNWESRVPLHLAGYRIEELLADPQGLSGVVAFDRPRLGDIAGLSTVHLQCHIGTDTLSLARLGARMTGLDFSPSALAAARDLAARAGVTIDYVESDVDDAVEVLGTGRFDVVYTGIGALCWLPSIRRWAGVVAALLRPGGRLFMREGHPVLWSLSDPRPDGLLVVEYPYFEVPGGTRFVESSTYVPHEGEVAQPVTIGFNHGLGEIVTALIDAGMELTALEEHRSVPWNPLGDAMVEGDDEEFRLREGEERLPLTYTLQAVKRP